jgi:hypothetical protein
VRSVDEDPAGNSPMATDAASNIEHIVSVASIIPKEPNISVI